MEYSYKMFWSDNQLYYLRTQASICQSKWHYALQVKHTSNQRQRTNRGDISPARKLVFEDILCQLTQMVGIFVSDHLFSSPIRRSYKIRLQKPVKKMPQKPASFWKCSRLISFCELPNAGSINASLPSEVCIFLCYISRSHIPIKPAESLGI